MNNFLDIFIHGVDLLVQIEEDIQILNVNVTLQRVFICQTDPLVHDWIVMESDGQSVTFVNWHALAALLHIDQWWSNEIRAWVADISYWKIVI